MTVNSSHPATLEAPTPFTLGFRQRRWLGYAIRYVIAAVLIAGLPITLLLSWIFDIRTTTPEPVPLQATSTPTPPACAPDVIRR